MHNHNIICGKFDCNIKLEAHKLHNPEKVRIGSVNPEHLEYKNFEPIATNGKVVLHNGHLSDVRDFLATIHKNDKINLIVLTLRERDSILDELVDFDLKIDVFEVLYPIFKHIKYVSNINYI